ncbi:hypothetical protein CV770_31430 [Bradyrhizobium sp. AC87j1]|uniref:hypothetical protein n=1 Tax=Bradyrhizobium sp. AC87j1 TaxID=2055894 RepID=UPI000CEC2357|nr:hypothetical protein [Bradyrhizobium sp. AC87j1]PPQ15474.1 hypothetical protein CV770_31430 [Bradyrhizobium sp. AC87j1]
MLSLSELLGVFLAQSADNCERRQLRLLCEPGFDRGKVRVELGRHANSDPVIYDKLVADTYKVELKGKKLVLNAKIPRIVKRYEEAFNALGLEFYKTRPAREFMSLIGADPAKVLTADSTKRFQAIIKELSARYEKMKNVASFR